MDYGKTNLTLDEDKHSTYQIQRYEPGCVWINQVTYSASLIIKPHVLITGWRPKQVSDLTLDDFDPIINDKPDVLILGTGETLILPPEPLLQTLYEKGIGIECMNNRAACHTYTALASEHRHVVACLLI